MPPARALAVAAGMLCFMPSSPSTPLAPQDPLARQVTIYRDSFGIPHVVGETDAATMFGFAYAQAEDNFFRDRSDGWLAEWYAMTRARNVRQLKEAMRPLNMLFGNVMAADSKGNTWYLYNSAVPVRDPRFDYSGPVDGSDPATDWKGYHTLDQLPPLLNPATGWMQNCNTTPFLLTSSGNPDSSRFPRYMVRESDNWRGLASRRILGATQRFTWDEWVRAAFDTYVIAADSLLPPLLRDSANAGPLAEALNVLATWDRRSDTNSVAMTLFDRWQDARQGGVPGLVALDTAMTQLQREWGTWRVTWG